MLTTISREETRRLIAAGAPIVEVLPEREYREEYIPGAVNIPLKTLTPQSMAAFAKDQPLIVYCFDQQ